MVRMKVKADKDGSSPHASMLATQDVATGLTANHPMKIIPFFSKSLTVLQLAMKQLQVMLWEIWKNEFAFMLHYKECVAAEKCS
ncbi:hypothetical protein C5167_045281 [Papaver somniferum]|uniref:Uncharacterized protein n=1 Tax=Papaver somniferum TaxID=3469 RepID=A0A4Y7LCY3_PAPSO|nr:hypothetical protein C5167_045281 [Papaver somniferum]